MATREAKKKGAARMLLRKTVAARAGKQGGQSKDKGLSMRKKHRVTNSLPPWIYLLSTISETDFKVHGYYVIKVYSLLEK